MGSVAVARGLSSCGSRALERRLTSGTWAQLLRGMWDLPRPRFEPDSPALAGRFLTTVPPEKSLDEILFISLFFCIHAFGHMANNFLKIFLLEYSLFTMLLVSGVQQSESVIHIHISTLFLDSFPI